MAIQPRLSASAGVVPFNDLTRLHAGLRNGIVHDVALLVDSCAFVNGPAVEEFERAFAAFGGRAPLRRRGERPRRAAISHSARAGIGPGDEVIVPAMTFVATFEAVAQAGGRPVAVDVVETDYCIDPAAADAAVGPRTARSCPCTSTGSSPTCPACAGSPGARHSTLVEDACQAHGASATDVRAGSGADAAAFSFYPGEEPRRDGRRRRARHDDAALARRVSRATRARPARAIPPRRPRLHGPPRHDPGARPAPQAPASRRLERAAPRCSGRSTQRRLAGIGDLGLPPVDPAKRRTSGTCTPIRTARPGRLASLPRRRAGSPRGATTRSRRTSPARTRSLGYGPARSRSPRRSRGRRSRFRSSPGSPRSSSTPSSTAIRGLLRRG